MRRKNALRRLCLTSFVVLFTVVSVSTDYFSVPIISLANSVIKLNLREPIIEAVAVENIAPTETAGEIAQVTTKATEKATVQSTTAKAVAAASDAKGKIKTQTLGFTGSTNVANIHIANKTGRTIDVAAQLKIKPDFTIYKNAKPQVLIVHTHATEGYFPKESDVYYNSWATRTTDNSKNTIAVGAVIAKRLNDAGIVTIHDKTQHDAQAYNGSYERARKTISSYLKKYPSIDVVLDIHRDAITYGDGTKLSPIVEIDGKKAAQIMIATGCNSGKITDHDNWIENFRFAIRLQQSCEKQYGKFARSMYFVSKKYNHDLTPGSLLIEMGSEANTLEQALYSAELLSNSLIPVLEDLQN